MEGRRRRVVHCHHDALQLQLHHHAEQYCMKEEQ